MADAEEVFSDKETTQTLAQAQVKSKISFSCACVYACAYACVVPGLHVGFLCLCLRRTCKSALRADYL